ncbi:MAG: SPFH/Band 7/PHB domain protein [Gemmatimonadetes bacterium]|nr:SPFH/Band 7/PHB domain protein [Gemmatimonadota bacterium]
MLILLIALSIFLLIFAFSAVRIVRPFEKGVVERLGKYSRTVDSGISVILPFFETIRKVDVREMVVDVPPQEVITKDNVAVTVDAVIYYEVTDPYNFSYNIADYYTAIIKLAQTNLRNVIGDMQLDESLVSRDVINTKLRDVLDDATGKWGSRVTRVEIQRIEPPADVTEAMHRQMKAERTRRALILEAEGEKQAAILRSEGEKQSQLLRAQGEADAIKAVAEAERFRQFTVAEGEGQAIERVYQAIHNGRPTPDLLAIKYLETLAKIAEGDATKIFMPLESSSLLSGLAAMREAFDSGARIAAPDAPGRS